MIFDHYDRKEIERSLKAAMRFARMGYSSERITRELKLKKDSDELISIARARLKGGAKFSRASQMYMNLDDLRFATPENVALYRAKRLRCKKALELCSGIGGQTVFTAKQCKQVLSIEKDERKVEYAKLNALVYGARNIEFVCGDVLDKEIISKSRDCELGMCDPSRPPEEEERSIQSSSPSIAELKKAYPFLKGIAFEAPPQLTPEKITEDCEREYISVGGKLNRLTIYTGSLKTCEISAVLLPKDKLYAEKQEPIPPRAAIAGKYIYDVDAAILKAGLLGNLNVKAACLHDGKLTLLTSDELITNPFLKPYEVVARCKQDLNAELMRLGAGKAILRGSIPEKDYWKVRADIEKGLNGRTAFHVFLGTPTLICKEV